MFITISIVILLFSVIYQSEINVVVLYLVSLVPWLSALLTKTHRMATMLLRKGATLSPRVCWVFTNSANLMHLFVTKPDFFDKNRNVWRILQTKAGKNLTSNLVTKWIHWPCFQFVNCWRKLPDVKNKFIPVANLIDLVRPPYVFIYLFIYLFIVCLSVCLSHPPSLPPSLSLSPSVSVS